jgi:glycosyltransferase involved in cell wall biosynthesis
VEVVEGIPPDASAFDLVHGLGLDAIDVRHFRLLHLPVALSSIYASYEYAMALDGQLARKSEALRRGRLAASLAVAAVRLRHVAKVEALLARQTEHRLAFESADLLLPNARGEAELIHRELGVSTPTRVVPNGVDASVFQPPRETRHRTGALYVGRIDPFKNQLGLIRALAHTDTALTIVGPVHPHHRSYLDQCRAEADGTVKFVFDVPHDELAPYYQTARVHVLPSWYETTGLVSLEAALCGCNVVSTVRGHAREYLGGDAWYCDPLNPRTIGSAVLSAARAEQRPQLRERILNRYTWDHVAQVTLSAYRSLVDSTRAGISAFDRPETAE